MFFVLNVIRDEQSKGSVNAPLIKVPLEEHLKILIKVIEFWSRIQTFILIVVLGGFGLEQLGSMVISYVLKNNHSVLCKAGNL